MIEATDPHWYEVRYVDGELPMEYYAEKSEVAAIFAESEAMARLAVPLVYGDRYEVIEFLGGHGIEDHVDVGNPTDFAETRPEDFDPQINAYEVFAKAKFRVSFREDGDRVAETFGSLQRARDWYEANAPDDDYGPSYEGWTNATHGSILQRLSPRRVDEFLDA